MTHCASGDGHPTETATRGSEAIDRARFMQNQDGFSLVEAVIATMILAIAVLGLAQVFVVSYKHLAGSSARLVAREKARETIETIHAVRDARVMTWEQLQNDDDPGDCPAAPGVAGQGGGLFVNGYTAMNRPAANGLVNSVLDEGESAVADTAPGPNGRLGDDDDVPLSNFQREIKVCTVSVGLRRMTINIRYRVAGQWLTYSVTTMMSSRS